MAKPIPGRQTPAEKGHGQRAEAERRAREAAALRENLARRKAQQRQRRDGADARKPGEGAENA
jgi:hypothetical protein